MFQDESSFYIDYSQDDVGEDTMVCEAQHQRKKCIPKVLGEWLPNSPNFNPIENLWDFVKRRINLIQPKTRKDLI